MLKLKTEAREGGKHMKNLRKSGKMPAVFYGNEVSATPIAIATADFMKVWREGGESSVIELETPDGVKDVLIHDVQTDPVKGVPQHADFYVIDKNKKITVTVPLEFEGVSPAVKELNGTLVKVMHEIEIEVLPKDLPHSLKVDISMLKNFESRITIADITLPESAEATDSLGETVALVAEQKEEEEAPAEPIDMSAIEVEQKGKKEEEGVLGGEAPTEQKEE